MRSVYADTGAWIALVYRRDRAHEEARKHFVRPRESAVVIAVRLRADGR